MHAAMNTSRGTRGKRGRLLNRNPSALEVWEGMQNVATESDCIATEMDGESTVGGESVEIAVWSLSSGFVGRGFFCRVVQGLFQEHRGPSRPGTKGS